MTKQVPPWFLNPTGGKPSRPILRVEPTEEERRNGWTTETLNEYLAERAEAQAAVLDWTIRPKPRPTRANGTWNGYYRPLAFWNNRKGPNHP